MFEWLDEEMNRIKTRKFHLVDGPASDELRRAVESCDFPLPPSYREFVLRYGNAKLYHRSSNWLVQVFAGPREAESDQLEPLIHFGRTETSLAYFKESLLVEGKEAPVFEWRHGQRVQQTADSFEDWLQTKRDLARKRYKKKEWEAIEKGPPPFTDHERSIVEARKQLRWRVVGVAPNEDLRFEIQNESTMILPYLSVGIRGKLRPPKTGPLNGTAYLPVMSIRPGETKVVEFDCYKKFITPEETEVIALPDPEPEDRDQYWEFKT
ncbi:MAG: hypothetical protein JWM11_6987 [Planctomycetaceae bacterium]|nr:hypothetical protein [Planctomycetaceae bacterium]